MITPHLAALSPCCRRPCTASRIIVEPKDLLSAHTKHHSTVIAVTPILISFTLTERQNMALHNASKNVYISDSNVAGRGLFAAQDLPAGAVALEIRRPLVAALDNKRLPETCAKCFAWAAGSDVVGRGDTSGSVTLKTCLGCGIMRYCSKVGTLSSSLDSQAKQYHVSRGFILPISRQHSLMLVYIAEMSV